MLHGKAIYIFGRNLLNDFLWFVPNSEKREESESKEGLQKYHI